PRRRAERRLRTDRAPDLPDLGRGVLADRLRRTALPQPQPVHTLARAPADAHPRVGFDDRPFTSPTESYPNSFLVYTYAKQLLTPGQRVGYIALPPEMPDRRQMGEARRLGQLTYGGHAAPTNVLQRAMGDLEGMSVHVKALQRRRDLVVEA